MACGKAALGEESPWLPLWQQRAQTLLAEGTPEILLEELMSCVPLAEKQRGRDKVASLAALDDLVRYYRNNAHRMKYRLFREHHFPIGSGAVESAHTHLLQTRMKPAGQRWAMRNARKMARLRAADRTTGARALAVHGVIRRARRFRYARQGVRDLNSAERARSN